MSKEYNIDALIDTFGKHHRKAMKDHEKLLKRVEAGEVDMQDWIKDNFSISLALQTICKEIKALKDEKSR